MIDYIELSDFEINKLVAEKELTNILNIDQATVTAVEIIFTNGQISIKDYCNSWADMGHIIEREKISIQFRSRGKKEFSPLAKGFGSDREMATHKNPLRAAAIVYLMMGDE